MENLQAYRTKLLLLLLNLCLLQPITHAQNVKISEPINIKNDYGYEIIGRVRERVLLFRDRFDDFEVIAFDERFNVAWEKDLENIPKRGTQILGVVGSKNDFSVIFKHRKKGVTFLRLNKYDPGGSLIDSATIKDYGERVFETPALDIVFSENKNCFAVYNTAQKDKMEVTAFQIDKMELLWDKTVTMSEEDYDERVGHFTVSNFGDFFMVGEMNNRRNKMENHAIQIHYLGVKTDNLVKIPMPNYLTNDFGFTFDNENKQLIGAGLYADKNRERANGSFYIKLPMNREYTLKSEPFDDRYISILRGKDVEDDTKGIDDLEITKIALRKDGGVIMLAEQHYEILRGTSNGRSFIRDGSRPLVDYYYNDLLALAMNPDGTIHWKNVLHKKQHSQSDDAAFSSFMLFREHDKLRFLFNDEVKYENTCSEYVLSPLGELDRNSLLSTESQQLRLRFREGVQTNTGECIVPSEYRNKLRLVSIRY